MIIEVNVGKNKRCDRDRRAKFFEYHWKSQLVEQQGRVVHF